jgi:hypothetical protein
MTLVNGGTKRQTPMEKNARNVPLETVRQYLALNFLSLRLCL